MRWFRLYTEIIDDPKIAKMNDSQFRIFIYLLAVASEHEKDGLIALSLDELAWRIRQPKLRLLNALRYLEEVRIIACYDEGVELINWNKRQFKSDNVTERTKRSRERSRERLPERHQSRADTETETEQSRGEDLPVDNLQEDASLKNSEDNDSKEIKTLLKKISELKPDPKFYQDVSLFVTSGIPRVHRKEISQKALLHSLKRLTEEITRGENISHPRAYLQAVMEAENGHYRELEEQKKKEALQPSKAEAIQCLERFDSIMKRR